MKPSQIKQLRTQALLKELLPEAFAQMGNEMLHELNVLDVTLSHGRSDAKIYLDPTGIPQNQEPAYLSALKKATHAIQTYIKNDQGWFRSPNLTFVFDHQLEHSNTMEALFDQVNKELHSKK